MQKKPEKLGEKVILDTPFKKIYEVKFKTRNGNTKNFVISGQNSAEETATMIVPITKNGEIIYLEEFRYGPEKYIINFPIGMHDIGLSEEENCKKELKEETGYIAGKFIFLGQTISDNYSKCMIRYFLALDCEDTGETELEENEYIEINKTNPKDFGNMILDQKVECALTISSYYLAINRLKKNNFS